MLYKDRKSYPLLMPGQASLGIGILISTCIFMLLVTGFIGAFLGARMSDLTAATRILAVLQDILVFMFPALLTAMLVTKLPATLLQVDCRPGISFVVVTLIAAIVAIPVMNLVIAWNADITLPESWSGFYEWSKAMEDQAQASAQLLIGGDGIGSFLIGVCIVGILAPLTEELFFRGALQRLMLATRLNAHVAIWITAFIFSLFHMQFFGFVPRLLLGAFFGYAAYWSGSLWTSVIAHVFNNTLVVVATYVGGVMDKTETIGAGNDTVSYILVGVSVLLTFMAVAWMSCHRVVRKKSDSQK